jgi:hypothetical protein
MITAIKILESKPEDRLSSIDGRFSNAVKLLVKPRLTKRSSVVFLPLILGANGREVAVESAIAVNKFLQQKPSK